MIALNERRIGDFFALSNSCSITLLNVSHNGDGEINLARLLHYKFTVTVTLHCDGTEERRLRLPFQFSGAKADADGDDDTTDNAAEFSDNTGRRYLLAVQFIDLEEESVNFSLLVSEAPSEKEYVATTLSGRRSDEMEVVKGDDESMDKQKHGHIFLLGVEHDDAEEELDELTSILHFVQKKKQHQHQQQKRQSSDLLVLWEFTPSGRENARLRPDIQLDLHRFSLPLEGILNRTLQSMLSAYLLYILYDVSKGGGRSKAQRLRLDVADWHGYTKQDIERYTQLYGSRDDPIALHIVASDCVVLLRAIMRMGECDTLDAFSPMTGSSDATLKFVHKMAHLVERVILTEEKRDTLVAARKEYYKDTLTTDPARDWYFKPFFLNYVPRSVIKQADHRHVRGRHASFRRLLMIFFRLLVMRGPLASTDQKKKTNNNNNTKQLWQHGYQRPIPERVESTRALGDALENVAAWARGHQWELSEQYFARLSAEVYDTYGHIGSSLYLLMEEGLSDRRRLLELGNLVTQYRDMQSFLHTLHCMRTTECSLAVLVVGSAHIGDLERLFLSTGYIDVTVHNMPLMETTTVMESVLSKGTRVGWAPRLRAYLALEALNQWLLVTAPEELGETSLQLYYFMRFADNLNPSDYDPQSVRQMLRLAQLMRLFAWLMATHSPYNHGHALQWPEHTAPTEEARRLLEEQLRYPPVLVNMMMQVLREQWRPKTAERVAGQPIDSEMMTQHFIEQPAAPFDLSELRTDWSAAMGQADRDREIKKNDDKKKKKKKQQQAEPKFVFY